MTRFYFNKEEFTSHVSPEMDMEAVFETLNNLHKDREVFISSIVIDGKEVDFEKTDPATLTAAELQKAEKVEIFEAPENLVLLSAFVEMLEYLENLPSLLPDLLAGLRETAGKETFEHLADFLESIQFMIMLFNAFYKMNPDYNEKEVSEFNAKVTELLDIFQEIVSSQQEKDTSLIADLIEFDLADSLDFFKKAIKGVNDYLLSKLDEKEIQGNA